ncbi:MAG: hypothetical protein WA102_04755 [Candidatus Methanoperedens sp.]
MKTKDIIFALVALVIAFFIIGILFKLLWLLAVMIIAYIVYLFLKKAL